MLCWDHVILYVVLTKKGKKEQMLCLSQNKRERKHFDMYYVVYSIKYIYVLLFVPW